MYLLIALFIYTLYIIYTIFINIGYLFCTLDSKGPGSSSERVHQILYPLVLLCIINIILPLIIIVNSI